MNIPEKTWWMTSHIDTNTGKIPRISTQLNRKDKLGHLKVRLGFQRMKYLVPPGLYGIGNPDSNSPVLVTANYKLSFDKLRRELEGMNAWILVLDTKGINVWCAAGKRTFGTDELVERITAVNLHNVVSHKKLILPQLGAPGVAAHIVTQRTGFKISYGPVLAKDVQEYIQAGNKATPQMREVRFSLRERLVLTPLEIVGTLKPLLMITLFVLILDLSGLNIISVKDLLPYFGAILIGTILVPALLPWIPVRAFALKGFLLGFIYAFVLNISSGYIFSPDPNWIQALVYF
ncbi:MAG: acetyl-CoA synthase subunit gamma, partial [Candidatus Aminicenantes bacterium]|nr:acetyl-CoA synthase subunit gamma [Candidatus Aminicenantes bacterium]